MLDVFARVDFNGDFKNWKGEDIKRHEKEFHLCVDQFFRNEFKRWSEQKTYPFLTGTFPEPSIPWFFETSSLYERRALIRLFTRGFNFESVCGTRNNTPKKERFCQYCISCSYGISLGDETHYFASCPRSTVARNDVCQKLGISVDHLISTLQDSEGYQLCPHISARIIARYLRSQFSNLNDPYL